MIPFFDNINNFNRDSIQGERRFFDLKYKVGRVDAIALDNYRKGDEYEYIYSYTTKNNRNINQLAHYGYIINENKMSSITMIFEIIIDLSLETAVFNEYLKFKEDIEIKRDFIKNIDLTNSACL